MPRGTATSTTTSTTASSGPSTDPSTLQLDMSDPGETDTPETEEA